MIVDGATNSVLHPICAGITKRGSQLAGLANGSSGDNHPAPKTGSKTG